MSINKERLNATLRLVTGDSFTDDELTRLKNTLGVPEEILAHLALRRDVFAKSERVRAAIQKQAEALTLPATRRVSGIARKALETEAQAALAEALLAVIQHDLAGAEAAGQFDAAVRKAIQGAPGWEGAGLDHRMIR